MAEKYLLDPNLCIKDVKLIPVTSYNVGTIEVLVNQNFPLSYNSNFYKRLGSCTGHKCISFIAQVRDTPIGCIAGFIEADGNDSPGIEESSIINSIIAAPAEDIGLRTPGNPYYNKLIGAIIKPSKTGSKKTDGSTQTTAPPSDNLHAYISVLIVSPSFRGMGISKMLVNALLTQLTMANAVKLDHRDRVVYPEWLGENGCKRAGYHPLKNAANLKQFAIMTNRLGRFNTVEIHVDADSGVDKLYESLGFEVVERLDNHYGIRSEDSTGRRTPKDAYHMRYHIKEGLTSEIQTAMK